MDIHSAESQVVVVGGGLAGLTAAAYLARGGARVTLFEKAARPSGRAATRDHDGYRFNIGPHALYTGGAASEALRELGVTYTYGTPGPLSALDGGHLAALPTTPLGLLGSGLLGLGDKLDVLRLFATVSRQQPATLARVSVQDWLTQALPHPRARRLVAALARTSVYSAALDLVSADLFVVRLRQALKHPIHYVDGGWQTLVDGLRRAVEQAGARIVSGVRVEAVGVADGRARGARLHGGEWVPATAVIVATTPGEAASVIPAGAADAWRRRVEALVPAQVASLDVALRQQPRKRHAIVQDLDRARFMTTQSLYSRVAPPGGGLVYSFKQLDPRTASDPHADERALEALLDAALPNWRAAEVSRSFLPRIAAVGALPLASSGGLAGRPASDVPGVGGVYLAGDWVGPEGFLADTSLASARQAARLALATARGPANGTATAEHGRAERSAVRG